MTEAREADIQIERRITMNGIAPYAELGSVRTSAGSAGMPTRISGVMAMDSLREQCGVTRAAKATYEERMAERDALIRDARAASIPVAALMRVTGLSRDRISKISTTPSRLEQTS